jgi:2-succinyl-6-hydroxy-2,4-cyclohexadiene-1-carboxylate synthase
MGGRIALHFAVRYPDRVDRLVLESSSPGLRSEAERSARAADDDELARQILDRGVEWFVDEWEARPLFESQRGVDAAARAALRTRRLQNDAASLAAALTGLGTGRLPSLWEDLPRIETPVLILVGGEDRKFTGIALDMAAALPDARVVVVPDAGHAVHLERPLAWVGAVVEFLAQESARS